MLEKPRDQYFIRKKHIWRQRRRSPYDPIYERSENDLLSRDEFKHLARKLRKSVDEKKIKVKDTTLHSYNKLNEVVC